VVLDNQLDDATTIHWHGLRIDDEMDGVPAIQDPVQPGETFTYEFVVPDSGTFWYHPHVRANEQIEHGLQGMLIVREADEAVAAERVEERAFVVDDVSLNSAGSYGSFNANHMEQMHGRLGNHLLTNGENRVLDGTMRPGVPERWRIVNTANARMMSVEVEGAAWRVIAIDGALLPTPLELDRFRMPVGRRVDVEVLPQAGDTDVTLKILTGGERYPLFEATVEGEAGAGDWAVWPAEPLPEIQETTQTVTLDLNGENTETGLEWTINGAVWGDHVPMELAANTPTRIEITDLSGAEHPFHLHGQFFQVVSRNGRLDEWDGGLLDTVLVGGDDELVLYTAFENPGRWMAHCHILEHAELGMMTQMVVE
jgi:FtsP/CotA-like multicopper oxidase with cupredoxin domain